MSAVVKDIRYEQFSDYIMASNVTNPTWTACVGLQSFSDNDSLTDLSVECINGSIYSITTIFANMSTFPVNTTAELPPRITYLSSIVLIILYTLTTLAAVLGNSISIIVFAKGRRSNSDLKHFLINLAIADLIMAIFCIPFTFAYQITDNWIFSDFMCPLVQGCQLVSVTASVSTNTAIGIDRLIAVKFPLRRRVTDSRSKVVIIGIWIFAISLGVIPFFMCRAIPKEDGRVSCEEVFLDEDGRVVYGFFITIVTYFLPVIILSVTYSMIGRLLWRHKLPGNADDSRDAAQLKAKRKVVKMLATVVLLFGLCWLPLHLFITITTTFKHNVFGDLVYDIYFGVHWLSMANSFVNPVIYGFMNGNFRADLKSLAEHYICFLSGRRRLRYRPAAVRWRLGDSNVHDTSHASSQSFVSRSVSRREKELEPISPQKSRLCRSCQTNDVPTFAVSGICSCHIRANNPECLERKQTPYSGNGNRRNNFMAGKKRHYELCQSSRNSSRPAEGNGVVTLQNKYGLISENIKAGQRFDLHPVVRFDGSDVMVFNDHYKQDQLHKEVDHPEHFPRLSN